MHSITIDIPEAKRLEVNGMEFEIMTDDLDVAAEAIEIESFFKDNREKSSAEIKAAALRAAGYVDVMLGPGALEKITGGRKIGVAKTIEIMAAVGMAILEIYKKKVEDEYA